MSLHSNDSVIKRFTYDWLIRFAELHPFLLNDSPYGQQLSGVYNSRNSKFASISPLFTTVIVRHMPVLFYIHYISIEYGRIPSCVLRSSTRCSIIIGTKCTFTKLIPGTITRLKNDGVFFYGGSLQIVGCSEKNSITPDELKYLLQLSHINNFGKEISIYATLTEPLTFSELWPQVTRTRNVTLYINNLHYEENFVVTLRKNGRYGVPGSIRFYGVDVTDEAILKVVDYLMSLPLRHRDYRFQFQQPKPVSLCEAIYNKYVAARVPIGCYRAALEPFYMIGVYEYKGEFCCQHGYRPLKL